ncbi:fungal-specific transcription factor domain-containing protein [Ilyonectria destructans]|nr:fungal-specific transcription factor domain-containing protein [Ilyonectria destructans]
MLSPMPSDAEHDDAASPEDNYRPAKRKRIALACHSCRERKVRCDGSKPLCGPCGKRGEDPSNCSYTVLANSAKRVSEQEYIESLQSQVRDLQQVITDLRQHPGAGCSSQGLGHATNPTAGNGTSEGIYHDDQGHDGQGPATTSSAGNTISHRQSSLTNDGDPTLRPEHHTFPPTLDAGKEPSGPSPISAMGATIAVQTEPLTSRGNEFYGQSSVLSLLREIPQSEGQHTGQHAQSNPAERQLNTPRGHSSGIRSAGSSMGAMLQSQYALPPREIADNLMLLYFSHVHVLYPLIHSIGFQSRYESLWTRSGYQDPRTDDGPDIGLGSSGCPRPVFFCALNAMLALGCQFSDLSPEEKDGACATFYGRMKDLLHIELLDNGSVSHVQALLLAGHYLLCTQYPTRCYNIIGLACRMAVGLGLHANKCSERFSFTETEIRRRVWYGCLQMEMTVSMTLGRPPSMRIINDVPLPSPIDDAHLPLHGDGSHQPEGTYSVNLFTVENIKLAKILAIILDQIYHPASTEPSFRSHPVSHPNHQDLSTVMHLDTLLEDFKNSLPDGIHWDRVAEMSTGTPPVIKRQSNVLHARYLHLKILLYRPSFSWFCSSTRSELQRREHVDSCNTTPGRPKESKLAMALLAPCAVACVDATCDLVRLLERAKSEDATAAWWFGLFYLITSGTILILAECIQSNKPHFDQAQLDAAWESCLRTLKHMGDSHSRAQGYIQSLKLLRERALSTYSTTREQSGQPTSASQHRQTTDASTIPQSVHPQSRNRVSEMDERVYEEGVALGWVDDFDEFGVTPLLENWEAGLENIMMPSNIVGDFGIGYPGSSFL